MTRLFPRHVVGKGDGFGPLGADSITLEHIDVEHGQPLTFTKRSDLRAYCREHKLSSGALL